MHVLYCFSNKKGCLLIQGSIVIAIHPSFVTCEVLFWDQSVAPPGSLCTVCMIEIVATNITWMGTQSQWRMQDFLKEGSVIVSRANFEATPTLG